MEGINDLIVITNEMTPHHEKYSDTFHEIKCYIPTLFHKSSTICIKRRACAMRRA